MADFTDPTDRSMALASLLGSLWPYPEPHGLPVDNFPRTASPYQGRYVGPTAFEEADYFSLPARNPFVVADHGNLPRTASLWPYPEPHGPSAWPYPEPHFPRTASPYASWITAFEEADRFSLPTRLPLEFPFEEVADHVNFPRSVWPLEFPFEDVDHVPIKGQPQDSPLGILSPDADVFYQGLTLEFQGEEKQVNGEEEEEEKQGDGERQPLIGEPEPSSGCCGEWKRSLTERAAVVVKRIKRKLKKSNCFN